MRNLLFLLTFIVLACGSKKPLEVNYISVKTNASTDYERFGNHNLFYIDMGVHKFQMNDSEVIYDASSRKFGLRNSITNQILITDYTYLAFLSENYLIAGKGYLNGIIDRKGNVIIPPIYPDINLQDVEKPFFLAQKNGFYGILATNGTELYPFTTKTTASINTYKNKVYIVTVDENYTARLLKIADGAVEIMGSYISFTVLNKNLAALHYIRNSVAFFGVYNMETDTFLDGFDSYYFHKPKNEIWVKSKKSNFKYFDSVIDSTFTLKENAMLHIEKIENDHFFMENEHGIQILNLEGEPLPFTYPKIESYNRNVYENVSTYGKEYADYQKELFKFYTNKDSKKYGIINSKGTVIVEAEKYDAVEYRGLANFNSYDKNLPPNKKDYLIAKNFDQLFYAYNYYTDSSLGQISIYKQDGTKFISIPIDIGDDCNFNVSQFSVNGHLMVKCNEVMKIYDLDSQQLVLEVKESKSYENFKERNPSGYYYFTFTDSKRTTINYLSNKLKLLYRQEVASDSIWYKMIKGDKVYFQKNNKVGLIDFEENVIIPADYDKIDIFHAHFNLVRKEEKYGVVLNNNKVVIDLLYDKIIYNVSNQSFNCYLDGKEEVFYLNQIQRE